MQHPGITAGALHGCARVGYKSPGFNRITSRRQRQRGDVAGYGVGRKGNGEHPSIGWVTPVTPEVTELPERAPLL